MKKRILFVLASCFLISCGDLVTSGYAKASSVESDVFELTCGWGTSSNTLQPAQRTRSKHDLSGMLESFCGGDFWLYEMEASKGKANLKFACKASQHKGYTSVTAPGKFCKTLLRRA